MSCSIRTAIGVACALVFAAACGCGGADSSGRQPVSGEVYLNGQPINNGQIRFTPTDAQSGDPSGAVIINGAYTIPADKGLAPGTYKVWISAPEGGGSSDELPGDSEEAVVTERIPPEYNSESEHTVEVKTGAENKFDFRIE